MTENNGGTKNNIKLKTMEYRIKMIQKYNGENTFIPQYRKDDWEWRLINKIFWSPILFLLWLAFNREGSNIIEYFKT